MQLITMLFIIISALHISGGVSAHHRELIKLYVQPWVLSAAYLSMFYCTRQLRLFYTAFFWCFGIDVFFFFVCLASIYTPISKYQKKTV